MARATKETSIDVSVVLDGDGSVDVSTGIPFFDHMLSQLGKHGGWDLSVKAVGDLDVDTHHTVEDVGIALGEAFRQALGDKAGVRRFASIDVPLDEALVEVAVDLSGRPFLSYEVTLPVAEVGTLPTELIEDFFRAFADHGRLTLHADLVRGRNGHHIAESLFKSLARALAAAVALDPRASGVPSTKGVL